MPFKVHGEVSRTNSTSPKNRPTRTAARARFPFQVDPMSVSIKREDVRVERKAMRVTRPKLQQPIKLVLNSLNVALGVFFSVKMKSRIR